MEPRIPVPNAGHARIDGDHDVLLALLAKLNSKQVDSAEVISEIQAYIDAHFENEEQLMDEYGYPDAAEHKQAHQELRMQAAELIALPRGESPAFIANLARLIELSVENHMCGIDRCFAEFLNARQVEQAAMSPTGIFGD